MEIAVYEHYSGREHWADEARQADKGPESGRCLTLSRSPWPPIWLTLLPLLVLVDLRFTIR
jgi:hypothetical protein